MRKDKYAERRKRMKKRYLSRVLSLLLVLTMLAGFLIPAGAAGTESGTQGL